ncbi:MAG: hypothetical protein ACI89X_003720 [Planctomycetota bacterium]|jgi:hypothetical protein
MGKVMLLLLLAAACATPEVPYVFRLDTIEVGAPRAAHDPVRQDARRAVDSRVFGGVPTRTEMQWKLLSWLADMDPGHCG